MRTHKREKSTAKPQDVSSEDLEYERQFECNICLETAKDAVISYCGHLYCWSCIYQWLETRPYIQKCPVCKSQISRDKIIPLYGRGSSTKTDLEQTEIPPRPTPKCNYFTNDANQFLFPFFLLPPAEPINPPRIFLETNQQLNVNYLKLFFGFGLFMICWLLLV